MANPTATRDYSLCKAYCALSLLSAAFFGTAMLVCFPSRPLLALPVALAAFVMVFVMLCICGAGGGAR